jgi:hypothetical protein
MTNTTENSPTRIPPPSKHQLALHRLRLRLIATTQGRA